MIDSKSIAWKSALEDCSLFSDLPAVDMRAVLDITTSRTVEQGRYLFREGDVVSGFFLVRGGAVSIQRTSPGGKEKVIHVFRNGDTFGEGSLLMDYFPVDAFALVTSELLHFSRDGYVNLLETNSEFALRTIASLGVHLKELVDHIEKDNEVDAPCRVAMWLLKRCGAPDSTTPCEIELKVQKAALADELHMRSETLSRSLKRLGERGLVTVRGSVVTLPNPKELADFVSERYQQC